MGRVDRFPYDKEERMALERREKFHQKMEIIPLKILGAGKVPCPSIKSCPLFKFAFKRRPGRGFYHQEVA